MGLWKRIFGDEEPVRLLHTYTKADLTPIGEVMITFEVYRAGSESQAREFLASKLVSSPKLRIVVETPEGAFSKDVRGVHGPFASGI